MHHKRKRPKHQRAGCPMCKPWKDPRLKGKTDMKTMQEKRAGLREKDES